MFGDGGVGGERLTEHLGGEVEHRAGVAGVAEGGRGAGGRDLAERAALEEGAIGVVVGHVTAQGHPEPAQQDGDVGALGPVVGVELVEHEIGQAQRTLGPQGLVVGAQQELVEHLVVRQQDVGWVVAQHGAVRDEPDGGDAGAPLTGLPRAGVAGVEAGGHALKCRILGEELGEAPRLVVGERVHRVEDERLHAPLTATPSAHAVVEDRVQERLRLTGAGARGDDRRVRAGLVRAEILAGQAGVSLGLVTVGRKGGPPVEVPLPLRAGGPERQPQPHVRALEDAVFRIFEELRQRPSRLGVGERERGGEVVDQRPAHTLGLKAGQECSHGVASSMA